MRSREEIHNILSFVGTSARDSGYDACRTRFPHHILREDKEGRPVV